MKSTWRRWDRSQWTFAHWFYEWNDLHPTHLDQEVPTFTKDQKLPYLPDWQMHRFILFYCTITLALHQLYVYVMGSNFGPIGAFFFYYMAIRLFMSKELHSLRKLGHRYGYLDGDKHERDGVPDDHINKALISIMLATLLRPLMIVVVAYQTERAPLDMNWTFLPLELSLYGVCLDFYYYWYHRLMHDVDFLWKYHRTHHLTKHPNPLLAIYADSEQEFFDIIGIPLMTYFTMRLFGMPMGFYEWFLGHQYVLFSEMAGHSGLRLQASTPNPCTWLMRMFAMELVVEDHDLHHRQGWRKSYNYGKQTRIWDRVFGTCGKRIESVQDNVDYSNKITMPLY